MKHWKYHVQKDLFTKSFDFSAHQKDEKARFLKYLLNFDSKQYSIYATLIEEGCILSFMIQESMNKPALDNILDSIDLFYKECLYGKKN